MALSEVFLKTSEVQGTLKVKRVIDENAFDFLNGFISIVDNASLNKEALYNKINGKGTIVYGPVKRAIDSLIETNGEITDKIWI